MKSFNLWAAHGALNSTPVFKAFEAGVKRLGYKSYINRNKGDIDVIWSLLWQGRMAGNKPIWLNAVKQNKPIIVLEVGALKRNELWRMGLNGVNGKGSFGPSNNDDKRAKKIGLTLKDWQHNDGPILLAGQHNLSQQWNSPTHQISWTNEVLSTIRKHTDRKIIIRNHPRCPVIYKNLPDNVVLQTPRRVRDTYDDYDFDVNTSYAVINWCSTPGIEAALNGIPTFTGPYSLAKPVANLDVNNINNPVTPNRQQWLNDLAYIEWSLEELSTGNPLKRLTFNL